MMNRMEFFRDIFCGVFGAASLFASDESARQKSMDFKYRGYVVTINDLSDTQQTVMCYAYKEGCSILFKADVITRGLTDYGVGLFMGNLADTCKIIIDLAESNQSSGGDFRTADEVLRKDPGIIIHDNGDK